MSYECYIELKLKNLVIAQEVPACYEIDNDRYNPSISKYCLVGSKEDKHGKTVWVDIDITNKKEAMYADAREQMDKHFSELDEEIDHASQKADYDYDTCQETYFEHDISQFVGR